MRRSAKTTIAARAALSIATLGVALSAAACSDTSSEGGDNSAAVSPPAIQDAGTLAVCSALGLGAKPLFYYDENQKPSGVAVDLATAFAKELDLEYKAVDIAFPSLIPALQANRCDVIMSSLFITPEREKEVSFVPYLLSAGTFVAAPGNPKNITGMDDSLCGLTVATTVGQSAIADAEAQSKECEANGEPAIKLTQLDSAAIGEKLVANGQADAFMATVADLAYAASNSDGAFEVVGEPFSPVTIGAAVRSDNPKLQEALQGAFDAIRENGTYDEVLQKYDIEDLAYTD
jgi:polar amino acid transport system substrate-binding protein